MNNFLLFWAKAVFAFVILHKTKVEPSLAPAFVSAKDTWGFPANIREVRHCRWLECATMAESGYAGVWEPKKRRILIYGNALEDWTELRAIMIHEYGHAIGLDHNDNPGSVMNPVWATGGLVPTREDKEAARQMIKLRKK